MRRQNPQFAELQLQLDALKEDVDQVNRLYLHLGLEYHCTSMEIRNEGVPEALLDAFVLPQAVGRNYEDIGYRHSRTMTKIENMNNWAWEAGESLVSKDEVLLPQARHEIKTGKRLVDWAKGKLRILADAINALQRRGDDAYLVTRDGLRDSQRKDVDAMIGVQREIFADWVMNTRECRVAAGQMIIGPDLEENIEFFMADGPIIRPMSTGPDAEEWRQWPVPDEMTKTEQLLFDRTQQGLAVQLL